MIKRHCQSTDEATIVNMGLFLKNISSNEENYQSVVIPNELTGLSDSQ